MGLTPYSRLLPRLMPSTNYLGLRGEDNRGGKIIMVSKSIYIIASIVAVMSIAALWSNRYGSNIAPISTGVIEINTDAYALTPSISPDGNRVVFLKKRAVDELSDEGFGWPTLWNGSLVVTKIGSNSIEEVIDGRSGRIAWAPDASAFYCYYVDKKIAVDYENKLKKHFADYERVMANKAHTASDYADVSEKYFTFNDSIKDLPLEILRVDVEPLKVTCLHKGSLGDMRPEKLAISSDGKYLCFVSEVSGFDSMCIIDALTGKIVWEKECGDAVRDFNWAPYEHTICFSVSRDGLYLYDMKEDRLQKIVNHKDVGFSDITWLPNGKSILLVANNDVLKRFYVNTKKIENVYNYNNGCISYIKLSPNSKRLLIYDHIKKCLILVDIVSKKHRVLTKGKGYVDYPDRLWLSNSKIGFPMYSNPEDSLNTTFYVMDVDKNTLQAYKDAHRVLPEYSLAVKGKKVTLTFWDDVRGKWRLFVKKFGV